MGHNIKNTSLDEVIAELHSHVKQTWGVVIHKDSVKGLAFTLLKESGNLTQRDKFKSYKHVDKLKRIANSCLGSEVFSHEDIESLSGNLMYAMRVATRRPVQSIESLAKTYNEKYGDIKNDTVKGIIDTLNNDLFLLKNEVVQNITKTWRYLETTQSEGIGIVISKILKHILEEEHDHNNSKK